MIIYGWNSKILKHAPLENIQCENCGENATQLGIVSNYIHIFWIPFFPYSKKATMVCNNCSHVRTERKMPPDFKAKVKALKAAVPTPKYLFSGLGIVAALIVFISFSIYSSDQQQQQYLQAPVAGDVYVLKDNEEPSAYKYYLLKVKSLEEDSLLVAYNSFSYNGIPDKLESNDGFYDYTMKIAKADILDMDGRGEVQKIIRDYGDHEGYNRTVEYEIAEELPEETVVVNE